MTMTTICSDGLTVAGDGLACLENQPIKTDDVKIEVQHGAVYGFCGSARFRDAVYEWIKKGADPAQHVVPRNVKDTYMAAVFLTHGVVVYNEDSPYPYTYPYPFAMGSGEPYALGALTTGATPHEAVQTAMRYDLHTGGIITVLPIRSIETVVEMPVAAE